MANEQNVERVLDKIDPDKRQFIGRLIGTTAFVAPLVASFTVDSLNVADALSANGSILG
jgi:hypothetical protein